MSRVTDKMMYDKGASAISHTRRKLANAQEKASSGRNINKPSDDPVGEMKVLGLQSDLKRNEQLQKNITSVKTVLSVTESNLGELSDLIARAKELAITMSNGVNQSPETLVSANQEVEQLLLRAVQVGNARVGNSYIFGGYQTDKPPFDKNGNYYGDAGIVEVEVNPGQLIATNLPGSIPFFGVDKIEAAVDGKASTGGPSIRASDESLRGPASAKAEQSKQDAKQASGEAAEGAGSVEQDMQSKAALKSVGVIQAIKGLEEGLRTGDSTRINNSLDTLDIAFNQVVTARATVGARMKSLDDSMASLDNGAVQNQMLTSEVRDADALKVFSDLAKEENALNATLEVSNKLISKSLLDFIG